VLSKLITAAPAAPSLSLSHDQLVTKVVFSPLDASLASGVIDNQYFSISNPSLVKTPFLSHAKIFPDIPIMPKDPFFAKLNTDESRFLKEQDHLLFRLAELQQQNQVLLHALVKKAVREDSDMDRDVTGLISGAALTTLPMADVLARLVVNSRLRSHDLLLKVSKIEKLAAEELRALPLFRERLFPTNVPQLVEVKTSGQRAQRTAEAIQTLLERSVVKDKPVYKPKPQPTKPQGGVGRGGAQSGKKGAQRQEQKGQGVSVVAEVLVLSLEEVLFFAHRPQTRRRNDRA
jgi:hypothetical protein